MSIRDVLRYCNDTDIIALRPLGTAFGLNRTNIAKIPSQEYIYIYSEILYQSVKGNPKASTNHVRIKENS